MVPVTETVLRIVVTLRWLLGMSATLYPLRAFFYFVKRQKSQGGLSQVNKVDGPIWKGFLSQELANS
jgi:hypothetical protein